MTTKLNLTDTELGFILFSMEFTIAHAKGSPDWARSLYDDVKKFYNGTPKGRYVLTPME